MMNDSAVAVVSHSNVAGFPPCPRCYSQEKVVPPAFGARWVLPCWLLGLLVVIAVGPLMVTDLVVTLPLTMFYLLAAGPVLTLSRQLPACPRCALERPAPSWRETPCRPVRSVEPRSALRVQRTAARDEEQSGVRPLPSFGRGEEP